MPTEERKIKHLKQSDKPQKPANPLYDALTQQISATVLLARQIKADKSFATPSLVERFLEEFGRKAA